MRLLLNVLWLLFGGGLVIWLEYLLGGLLLCLTIVGIPFGVQCWKIAGLGLWPFGKEIRDDAAGGKQGCVVLGAQIFWVLTAGVWIFASHLSLALGLALTIIGIPWAVQHVKLAFLALAPFGKRVVVAPA
jgi:uncharacterized membrane protein YccF (DUF307 family)